MRYKGAIDWPIILIVMLLMTFGVMNIYSVDPEYGMKQLVRIGLGGIIVLVVGIVSSLGKNFFETYAGVFYFLGILALIGVLIVGVEINGAKAWYRLGPVTIQPVELMKISTALMIAAVLNRQDTYLTQPKTVLACFFLLGLPAILIMLQPDAGSLFVFSAFVLAMFREHLNPLFILVPIIFGITFLVSLVLPPTTFLLCLGILLWLAMVFYFIVKDEKLTIQTIFFRVGALIGLAVYFFVIVGYDNVMVDGFNLLSYFNEKQQIWVRLSALFMGFLSLLAAGVIFSGTRSRNKTLNPFTQLKMAKPVQIVMGATLMVGVLLCLFFVSTYAPIILDKLPSHQRDRIMVLFEGEAKYRDTSGYNLLYSKTAIGSGELWGTGWNKGTVTDGRFVPEQWTDYIFCTVGEEWGFFGSSMLVLLYAFLIARILFVAEKQRTTFARFYGYSIGSIILLHFFVNIGMVMGLFPTVGIPLPFLSYGGSSLWGFTIMIFIFLKLNYDNKQLLL